MPFDEPHRVTEFEIAGGDVCGYLLQQPHRDFRGSRHCLSKLIRKGIAMADMRDELVQKETALIAEIERLLPDFARTCRDSEDVVIIHQDSFAEDYQDDEYTLFGKAIKFAGVLVQPETERRRSPLVSIHRSGGDFQGIDEPGC